MKKSIHSYFIMSIGMAGAIFFAAPAVARNIQINPDLSNVKIQPAYPDILKKKQGRNLVSEIRTTVTFNIHNKKGQIPIARIFPKRSEHPTGVWNCNLGMKPFLTCTAELGELHGEEPLTQDQTVSDYFDLFLSPELMTRMFPLERINRENPPPLNANIPGIEFSLRYQSRETAKVTCTRFRMDEHFKLKFECK